MNHLTHILTGFCLVVQSFCLLRQAWFFGSFYHEMRDVLRELKEVVAELKAMTPGAWPSFLSGNCRPKLRVTMPPLGILPGGCVRWSLSCCVCVNIRMWRWPLR